MAAVILRLKTRKKKKKDSIRSSSKKKRSTRSVPGAIGSRIGTNFEEGRIEREVWPMMRKGQGGGTVLYGKAGKCRHLDANVEKGVPSKRDFMSRNSPGSPTFMFYPVIIMSTYTLDKTKHYPTSFRRRTTSLPILPASSITLYSRRTSGRRRLRSRLVVIGIRPRRGNASHFWDLYKVPRTSFFRLYFEAGMPIDTIQRQAWTDVHDRRFRRGGKMRL